VAQAALVESLIKAGDLFVQALDTAGQSPSAALWLYRADSDDWVLVLAREALDHAGPKAAYQSILDIFSRFEPQFEPLKFDDIVILPTRDQTLAALRRLLRTPPLAHSQIRARGNVINGILIEDVLIYRLAPPSNSAASA